MSVIDEERKSPLPSWVVLGDIAERNRKNAELYTDEELHSAERLRRAVERTYESSRSFPPNVRENFIAVKVSVSSRDRIRFAVTVFDAECEKKGIVIVKRGNSKIYRLVKEAA